jgi:hypothetical protein
MASNWLKAACEHLDGLYEDLKNPQAEHDLNPLTSITIETAKEFLSSVQNADRPEIAPSPNSEIVLTWKVSGKKYKAWIDKTGKIDYCENGQSVKKQSFVHALKLVHA